MIGGLIYGSASWWCVSELYFTCFRQYRGCKIHHHNLLVYFRQSREIKFWIFTARRLMILTYQITRCISERHNLQPPSNAFSLTIRFSITETNGNSRDILQLCIYLVYMYIYISYICQNYAYIFNIWPHGFPVLVMHLQFIAMYVIRILKNSPKFIECLGTLNST